jgi:hypothetical protein
MYITAVKEAILTEVSVTENYRSPLGHLPEALSLAKRQTSGAFVRCRLKDRKTQCIGHEVGQCV